MTVSEHNHYVYQRENRIIFVSSSISGTLTKLVSWHLMGLAALSIVIQIAQDRENQTSTNTTVTSRSSFTVQFSLLSA